MIAVIQEGSQRQGKVREKRKKSPVERAGACIKPAIVCGESYDVLALVCVHNDFPEHRDKRSQCHIQVDQCRWGEGS